MNTTTPDGCTVNESGAWTINNMIQTQKAALPEITESQQSNNASAQVNPSEFSYILNTKTKKFHYPS